MPSPKSQFSYLAGRLDEVCEEQGISLLGRRPDVPTLLRIYHKLVPSLHPEDGHPEDEGLNQPILSKDDGWRDRDSNKLYKWICNQIQKYV